MSVGPNLLLGAGLACAGLGLVGAGAGATFSAQVSGTMSISTGTVGLSLNGRTGSNARLDVDGQDLGSHFTSLIEDLRLKNIGTLDLARTYLTLSTAQCTEQGSGGDDQDGDDQGEGEPGNQDGQGNQGNHGGGDGGDGALAHALHVTVTDVTHHVIEYDGALCSSALDERALRYSPAAGETIAYQLVLRPEDQDHGLPAAARHAQADVRVTFTGFDY
jgi:hypothetical protein